MSIEQVLLTAIQHWYVATGYFGVLLAMTIESCCIPLPSEIVMPLAGYMVYKGLTTSTGPLNLVGITIAGTLGCVLGSAIAYWIGASGGRELLLRYGKYILISQRDSDRADRWFAKYGSPVAFFSRLLPVVRTYISLPAGIARMNFGKFLLYTFLGSLPWTFALAYLGVAFGPTFDATISKLSTVFHGLDVVIIVLVVAAVAYYIYRHFKHGAQPEPEQTPLPQLRPTRYGPTHDSHASNGNSMSNGNGANAKGYPQNDLAARHPNQSPTTPSYDQPTTPRSGRPR
ncbi:MAG TPA: DedA family protein [Ktedonobacterales bacterium]|nr:DedA family protein [Ktedonobacterales bacterium]